MCSNPIDLERGLAVDASANSPELEQRDHQLADSLGLPLWRPADRSSAPPDLLLGYDGPVLELKPPPPSRTGGVRVDFASAALKWRLQGADLLLKAVRGRSRGALRIVDATAGLGRDSFAMAARGHQVLMVERSRVVAALLANGLERGLSAEDPLVAEICRRLRLHCGDARDVLPSRRPSGPGERESQAGQYDVVYLDPMFPGRENQALAKKEMQLLQRLLESPDNDAELLAAARACAHRRVVVKRPRKSPPLAEQAPDYQLSGRAIRFDVYVS